MDNAVKRRLQSVQFGEVQRHQNLAILPLIAAADGTTQYRTLGEALASWDIAITEVSPAGSAPELLVINRSRRLVLLMDGEELAGGRQNRALNTSILIREMSETRIPVSGTEQGRWAYTSRIFLASGNVMTCRNRSKKTRSVHRSLESCGAPQSDQGQVWAEAEHLMLKAAVQSPTCAMSDVYKARQEDLRKCDEVFKPLANQVGLLAFIDGVPAGLDLVSLTAAYARLHSKLVRSYALEALLDEGQAPALNAPPPTVSSPTRAVSGARHSATLVKPGLLAAAHSFLLQVGAADERQFPSVGHGSDFRYFSAIEPSPLNPHPLTICGSALVHANEVIHAAFFRLDEPE